MPRHWFSISLEIQHWSPTNRSGTQNLNQNDENLIHGTTDSSAKANYPFFASNQPDHIRYSFFPSIKKSSGVLFQRDECPRSILQSTPVGIKMNAESKVSTLIIFFYSGLHEPRLRRTTENGFARLIKCTLDQMHAQ